MNITLPQSPQVLAHRWGISLQYDLVHPLSLSSHSESIVKNLQIPNIISELGATVFIISAYHGSLYIDYNVLPATDFVSSLQFKGTLGKTHCPVPLHL